MKKEYAEEVAAKIIEHLEQGTAPWQRPWKPGELSLPYNASTGKEYRGINSMWLAMQGHGDPRWMTYNQANDAGAQVRKGSKGTKIVYWKTHDEEKAKDGSGKPIVGEDGKPKTIRVALERPRAFHAVVFNAEQIDGLPPLEPKAIAPEPERHARAEGILANSGANIQHVAANSAFYRPSTDTITLPERGQFDSADGYYATALHELGHWTGHPSRLDRDLAHPFGSKGYAREELRAEISSLMVGERLELGHDPGQHAAYVGAWIKALKEDPREIFRAAADAEKIASYVMDFEKEQVQEQARTAEAAEQQAAPSIDITPEPASPAIPVVDAIAGAREAAQTADDAFQAELVRVYGEKEAGDERYRMSHDDPGVQKAKKEFEAASDALRVATREARAAVALEQMPEPEQHYEPQDLTLQEILARRSELIALTATPSDDIDRAAAIRELRDFEATPTSNVGAEAAFRRIQDVEREIDSAEREAAKAIGEGNRERAELNEARAEHATEVLDRILEDEAVEYHGRPDFQELDAAVPNEPRDLTLQEVLAHRSELIALTATQSDDIDRAAAIRDLRHFEATPTSNTGAEAAFRRIQDVEREIDSAEREAAKAVNEGNRERAELNEARAEHATEVLDRILEDEAVEYHGRPDFQELDAASVVGLPESTGRQVGIEQEQGRVAVSYAEKEQANAITKALARQDAEQARIRHTPPENPMPDRTYLAVPYAEKEQAKAAAKDSGFRLQWDKENKAWFAPAGADLSRMEQWKADGHRVQTPTPKSVEDQYGDALKEAGLVVDGQPIMDGKIHRVPVEGDRDGETSGAYAGHLEGRIPGGYIQNFKTGERVNWKAEGTINQTTPEERARLAAEAADRQQKREAEQGQKQEATAAAAGALWKHCPPATADNAYCAAKGIADPVGIRTVPESIPDDVAKAHNIRIAKTVREAKAMREADTDARVFKAGDLLVPGTDGKGKLWTLQSVNPDFKSFMKGGRKYGLSTIAGVGGEGALKSLGDDSKPIIVAEGYATANTVSKLARQPVHVAFDSGNLDAVVRELRERFPTRPLMIAADNDHEATTKLGPDGKPRPNVGMEKATVAAAKHGAGVVAPPFKPGEKGSDWDDFEKGHGEEEAKREFAKQMALAKRDAAINAERLTTLARERDQEARNDPTTSVDDANVAAERGRAASMITSAGEQVSAVRNAAAQGIANSRNGRPATASVKASLDRKVGELKDDTKRERQDVQNHAHVALADDAKDAEGKSASAKTRTRPRTPRSRGIDAGM